MIFYPNNFLFFVLLAFCFIGCDKPSETSSSFDEDTEAWWETTTVLSGDDMEGRDTGSPVYAQAEEVVVERFADATPSSTQRKHSSKHQLGSTPTTISIGDLDRS